MLRRALKAFSADSLRARYAALPTYMHPLYMQIQQRFDEGLAPAQPWPAAQPPTLQRKPDSLLVRRWWSESPFDRFARIQLPIYRFADNAFAGTAVTLDSLIFNQPVRRDLIHRCNHWALMYDRRTTHRTRTPAEVHGSGRKPRPQKGSGRARMGNLRASSHVGGGKCFGHRPKDFRYPLNEKVKVAGLVAVLSGRLAEGRIRVYDTEDLDSPKAKQLAQRLPCFGEREKFLFVAPRVPNRNFRLAAGNIRRLKVVAPNEVSVRDVLVFDKVLFTVQSLREFSELLLAYMFQLNKPRAVEDARVRRVLNLDFDRTQPHALPAVYDPASGWQPSFQILRDYYREYRKRYAQLGPGEAGEPPQLEGEDAARGEEREFNA